MRRPRLQLVANKHCDVCRWRRLEPSLGEHLLDARELRRRVAAGEVVERDQRVRLAAAEVRLHLDNGVSALATQPPDGVEQEVPDTLGDERPPEELSRI